jgi:hypothetical protein
MRTLPILFILVTGVAIIAGCTTVPPPCITGSGNITSETRNLSNFEYVSLTMPATLIVRNGEAHSVIIEADDTILPLITSDVRSGVLTLNYRQLCVRPSGTIRITVIAPVINEVAMTGTGSIKSDGILRSERLAARITGAGDMDLAVETASLSTTITGKGNVTLHGTARDHTISLPGVGSVDAAGLMTEWTTVEIFGSGDAKVNASRALAVQITGAGNVLYSGNPRIDQTITGTGSVRQMA